MVSLVKIIPAFILLFISASGRAQTAGNALSEKVELANTPFAEVQQRAVLWVKMEHPEFTKSAAVTSGSKAECTVSFSLAGGETMPADFAGKISMKVLVDSRDNQYGYTVFSIKHQSKSGKASGGMTSGEKPECGNEVMPQRIWKLIREEADKCADKVISDLKAHMLISSAELIKEQE